MYIPKSFAETDIGALHAFMDAHPLAIIVTGREGLYATHLPLVLRPGDGPFGTLEGHVARANPHHALVGDDAEALVIFSGVHAHITPTWYPSKLEDARMVPTWNYTAVHAHGSLRIVNDPGFLRAHLARLTNRHEPTRGSQWTTDDPPAEFMTQQLKAIVGIELQITKLEGKWKMSQNRSAADVDGVIAGLRHAGDDAVADIVAERNGRRGEQSG